MCRALGQRTGDKTSGQLSAGEYAPLQILLIGTDPRPLRGPRGELERRENPATLQWWNTVSFIENISNPLSIDSVSCLVPAGPGARGGSCRL